MSEPNASIRGILQRLQAVGMVKGNGIYPPNDFTIDQAEAAIAAEIRKQVEEALKRDSDERHNKVR